MCWMTVSVAAPCAEAVSPPSIGAGSPQASGRALMLDGEEPLMVALRSRVDPPQHGLESTPPVAQKKSPVITTSRCGCAPTKSAR
jgi:hypothetical protein